MVFWPESECSVGLAVSDEGTRRRPAAPYAMKHVVALIRAAIRNGNGVPPDSGPALAGIIPPGASVLLKPNWVLHYNQGGATMECMVSHPVFVEAVLDEVLSTRPRRVVIGDSPIQLCQFDAVVSPDWQARLRRKTSVPIDFTDFRRYRALGGNMAEGMQEDARAEDRCVAFDLGRDSLLEPVSKGKPRFRITNYDPRLMAQAHTRGKHRYVLCREAFEADVIISLPKLKTHKKSGLTGALKNVVGLVSDKACLPHHRLGGTAWGGDCYAGFAPLKRLSEFCLDQANRRLNTPRYRPWSDRAQRVLTWHRYVGDGEIEGSWYGNDTAWRMVLDLNRLLRYGRADGTLADTVQRRVYTLTDGIIAGQGQGPLAPEPLELGVVTFAACAVCADVVHAGLLGMDYRRLPLVREAFGRFRYPLTEGRPEQCIARGDGFAMCWEEAAQQFGKRARPPRGWAGHVELSESRSLQAGGCS